MQQLAAQVMNYGLPFVFLNVLLDQLGLPIPAFPTLIVAGALVANGDLSGPQLLIVAFIASLLADTVWYLMGRRHGYRILKTLCRISLSQDSCVRQTETVFKRWGMPSLLVAKFIPGFSTVAPPIAGATRARLVSFLLYSGAGALVWAGTGISVGMIFHNAIDRIVAFLSSQGTWTVVILGAALLLFITIKWWQRRRFYEVLRMARISVNELHRLMDEGQSPFILEVRSHALQNLDLRHIPGAIFFEISELDQKLSELPTDREIILYCSMCLDEMSVIRVVRLLIDKGFTRVRMLEGGFDAWITAGFKVEDEQRPT